MESKLKQTKVDAKKWKQHIGLLKTYIIKNAYLNTQNQDTITL